MSDCHSSPLDVSYNLSGYFISNLVLVTSCVSTGGSICLLYICFCIIWDLASKHWFSVPVWKASLLDRWGGSICLWLSLTTLNSEEFNSVLWQFQLGGSIVSFTQVKLTTKTSLDILISWPFRMGSHWWHWTMKSSLCALAVSNGQVYHKFYLGKTDN